MKRGKQLIMEVDYYDHAMRGEGAEELEPLFAKCAEVGVKNMLWSTIWGGRAEYHSKILPIYKGEDRRSFSATIANILKGFDPLAFAVKMGEKYGINIIGYMRLYDHYWPGLVDDFVDKLEGGWWESRCGFFKLRGFPCFSLPEVREHFLPIAEEIISYGVSGIMFGLGRTHVLYANPIRQPNFFGYNQPIADAYAERYGVDIRKFDYVEYIEAKGGPWETHPYTYAVEYKNPAEFDIIKWHYIKGEGPVEFIRELRKRVGPKIHFAIESSVHQCPPPDGPVYDYPPLAPTRHFFDLKAMAEEGLLDRWFISGNWRDKDYQSLIFPAYEPVKNAGVKMTLWANDILTATGGHSAFIGTEDFNRYIEQFMVSELDAISIHEADFLLRHPQVDTLWNMLKKHFAQ